MREIIATLALLVTVGSAGMAVVNAVQFVATWREMRRNSR